MAGLIIVYGPHAMDNLVDRAIEQAWVEETIRAPDAIEPDLNHPDRVRAYRAVPERGGRVLRVVYVQDAQTYRIVTVFFDRGWRRKGANTLRP